MFRDGFEALEVFRFRFVRAWAFRALGVLGLKVFRAVRVSEC